MTGLQSRGAARRLFVLPLPNLPAKAISLKSQVSVRREALHIRGFGLVLSLRKPRGAIGSILESDEVATARYRDRFIKPPLPAAMRQPFRAAEPVGSRQVL